MSFDVEKLYSLLPAFYRIRDIERVKEQFTNQDKREIAELQEELVRLDPSGNRARQIRKQLDEKQSGPLKALLSLIAEQVSVLEEDLEQLYDDQFIETCAEWVVPYIGDLVGTRGLVAFPDAPFSQRPQVANTLAYRRRKGTAAVLEQLARDVTAWDASVVEYFHLLATTQYMNHLRLYNLSIADLKQWEPLERLNTPFDKMTRTIDVRRIETRRGKYNIPNIGVFLWRIGSYSITKGPAFKLDDRRYLFDALGKDCNLYNEPETEKEITHLAEPTNVPMPLSRRVLHQYLNTYYSKGKSIFLTVDDKEIGVDEIMVCNLSDMGSPPYWAHMPVDRIAIDPVLGRIALPEAIASPPDKRKVQVAYYYGFSANMGSGEYGRSDTFTTLQPVIKVPSEGIETIQDALNELVVSGGVVEIMDNDYHIETPVINIPEGKTIEIRATDKRRPILVLESEMEISGGENSKLIINGLLISGGRLLVPKVDSSNNNNKLRELHVSHCTLLPGPSPEIDPVQAQPAMPRMVLELPNTLVKVDKSIVGGMRAVDGAEVHITNSILDATKDTEIAYTGQFGEEQGSPPQGSPLPGALLKIENSTIIGKVYTIMFELVSNSIFLASITESDPWSAAVIAERLQQGCVRFSYLPPGSKVPRPYRCQPDLALVKQAKELGLDSVSDLPEAEMASIASRLRPVFTSRRYGDASYCQLSLHCAVEIRQGADDEAEMGAFHNLYQPQRKTNLRARLDEYLRFGLEAGIFYAS